MSLDVFGGRKFLGFIVILAVGVAVHVVSKTGLTMELNTLLLGAYGAFALGNVSNTLLAIRGGAQTPSSESQAPSSASPVPAEAMSQAAMELGNLAAAVTQLQGFVAEIHQGVALQNQAAGHILQKLADASPQPQAQANRDALRMRGFTAPDSQE